MTTEEFSNNFDTLVSSYRRFKKFDDQELLDSIEFSEYEKSLYLSKAQEELIKEIYSANYVPNSFESNEETRRQLDSLIAQEEITTKEITYKISDHLKHSSYKLNAKCWYIVYEQAKLIESDNACMSEKVMDVIPVTHDEYRRTIRNPFRQPNERKVLRLDSGPLQIELVSKYDIQSYLVRYISKPTPIILCSLTADNLNIDGEDEIIECALPSLLHQEILDRAVRLAVSTKVINNKES